MELVVTPELLTGHNLDRPTRWPEHTIHEEDLFRISVRAYEIEPRPNARYINVLAIMVVTFPKADNFALVGKWDVGTIDAPNDADALDVRRAVFDPIKSGLEGWGGPLSVARDYILFASEHTDIDVLVKQNDMNTEAGRKRALDLTNGYNKAVVLLLECYAKRAGFANVADYLRAEKAQKEAARG